MRPIALIPAHRGSERLPDKVMINLAGRPLLWHVWNCTQAAGIFESTCVVTDCTDLAGMVRSWGGDVIISRVQCNNGTERIASIIDSLSGEHFVNVQADMPHISIEVFSQLITAWESSAAHLVTPVWRIDDCETLVDPHIVKVVRAVDGTSLLFSRQAIPFVRDRDQRQWLSQCAYWAHVGIYGYTRRALEVYRGWPASPIEKAEKLEQLRFLDHGWRWNTVEVPGPVRSINHPDDIGRIQVQWSDAAILH